MRVSHFGVHWAPGGIPFLVQSIGAQNLISTELPSPFVVSVKPRTLHCPHAIDLTQQAKAEWVSDPLAQALLPIPGRSVSMLYDPTGKHERLLQTLQRLSTATEPLMRPLWWRTPQQMTPIYGVTNISPIIFFGGEASRFLDVMRHRDLALTFNRRVVISLRDRIPLAGVDWIETELTDVSSEPLEALGATALREYLSDPERLHSAPPG